MKDESDKRSDFRRFEDDIVAAIDRASDDLTIAELVGVLELHLHVLKCRFHAPKIEEIL